MRYKDTVTRHYETLENDINVDDYIEWLNGDTPNKDNLKEYIEDNILFDHYCFEYFDDGNLYDYDDFLDEIKDKIERDNFLNGDEIDT